MNDERRIGRSRRRLLVAIWVAVAINLAQFPIIELRASSHHRAFDRFTDPDLAFITGAQTRSVQTRFSFYLDLSQLAGPTQLVIYPGVGLAGEQLYGLGQLEAVVTEDYDPSLEPEQARTLATQATFEGELPDDRRYFIVADPLGVRELRTLRALELDGDLYVVDEVVLDISGSS